MIMAQVESKSSEKRTPLQYLLLQVKYSLLSSSITLRALLVQNNVSRRRQSPIRALPI